MYRYLLILSLIFLTTYVTAQDLKNPAVIDSVSYGMYYNGLWKDLIRYADEAISNDQAFYWLYLRAAYAAQQLGKPHLEAYYLHKVHQLYPDDTWVKEKLYINHFATGQYAQALRLNRKLRKDSSLAPYYLKRPVLHLLNAEAGYKLSTDESLYDPMYYGMAGAGFRIGSTPLYCAGSYLEQKNYYGTLKQHQLYLSATFALPGRFTISPAVHFTSYKIGNAPETIEAGKLIGNPVVISLSGTKSWRNFNFTTGCYYATISHAEQFHVQPSVTWFPLGNNNLSVQSILTYQTENTHLTGALSATVKPIKKIYITLAYLYANTRYFTEQNGLLVNNSYDITGKRYTAACNWDITDTWGMYAVYNHETKTETYYSHPYQNNMGITGIRKTF